MNDPDELDRLVDELNAAAVDGSRRPPRLEAWLAALHRHQGSDLYLVAGAPPCVRVQGTVRRLDEPVLDSEDIEAQVLPALATHAAAAYRRHGIADTSLRSAPGVRFRVNLHRERGHAAASIRALPARPPRLDELGLPAAVERLARVPHGLVLIGGPTGSGKTTTVAALVELINGRDARHIVTIEDPIEFEHTHAQSVIEQIEIGVDAPDFATALRSAVRQSPDVIVIGEMRDPETIGIALAAGETGHLVLTTLHTADVASTVSRIADGFPAERQPSIRQEMSMALAAVMTQILVPKVGGGRVPAVELLMVGYGARQQIRKNALQHLHQEITMSRRAGSCTFEESLAQLVRHGWIDVEEARARAIHRDELEGLLAGFAGPGGAGSRISP